VQAIKFVGVEYAIDPDKCIECGACAKVCPAGIISNPAKDPQPTPHAPETMTCDAVILGAGGSGLVAAVRYKQLTGKNVVVLEKSKKVGGNTNLGHAFVVRYSKLHEKAGMPDLREEAVESIWNGSDGKEMSKNLLRKAVYGLSDMFDWLCEFGGVEENFRLVDLRDRPMHGGPFVGCPGFFDFPNRTKNVKSNDHSMGPGWMGTFVVDKMMEQCEKLGIPVLTEHRGVKLNVDEAGNFQSVEVDNPGGKLTVYAKCVLLASGGFSHNERIMRRLRPSFFEGLPAHSFTVASNTGDAIDMAEEIGAKTDFVHIKSPLFGPVHHPYNFGVVSLCNDPRIAMVNINGRRFKNEGAPPEGGGQFGPLEDQPEKKAYAIFDAPTAEAMGAELIERSRRDPGMLQGMLTWKEQLEYECSELDIAAHKADTLEELAQKAGISPVGLVDEIEKYNMFCQQKRDEDFDKPVPFLSPVKEGPFYAVLMLRFNEGSEGGLVNDNDLRLVKEDGTPFHGIFVAGDTCRGVLKQDDEGGKFGEMPWAMASGYLVAQSMADYTK
jgi:succinate dehydrogenase/fumarate reductase flavoprotein subunit